VMLVGGLIAPAPETGGLSLVALFAIAPWLAVAKVGRIWSLECR